MLLSYSVQYVVVIGRVLLFVLGTRLSLEAFLLLFPTPSLKSEGGTRDSHFIKKEGINEHGNWLVKLTKVIVSQARIQYSIYSEAAVGIPAFLGFIFPF